MIAVCFAIELVLADPDWGGVAFGFIPQPEILANPAMLYIAIGILGATVMPHNLYLHSSIVQTRRWEPTPEGRREAVRFATIDSTVALSLALFVNAAILILAAAAFHADRPDRGRRDPGRLPPAQPDAGCGRGQHAVRAGAAGLGPELDHHRDARRPDRDGGLPPAAPGALAAAASSPAWSRSCRR